MDLISYLKNKNPAILSRFYKPGKGGVDNFVDYLHKNIDSTVYSSLPYLETDKDVKRYPYLLIFNEPIFSPSLFFDLLKEKIIVVNYPSPYLYLISILLKLLGKKIIVVYHAKASSSKVVSILGQLFDLFIFYPTSFFIDKILYTYKGLIPSFIRAEQLELPIPSYFKPLNLKKKYDILFVGRLTELKRVDWILRAVKEADPSLKIAIIGDGPSRSYLEKLAKELSLNVDFLGFVDNKDLPKFYNSSKLFILPSRMEGYPISIIEAKACNVPILASSVGGIPSMIDKNYLFSSFEELVNKLRLFFNK